MKSVRKKENIKKNNLKSAEYRKEWLKERTHTIPVRIPIELYEDYKKELEKLDKSFNGFLNEKLKEMFK